jgi:hypothetical protein
LCTAFHGDLRGLTEGSISTNIEWLFDYRIASTSWGTNHAIEQSQTTACLTMRTPWSAKVELTMLTG